MSSIKKKPSARRQLQCRNNQRRYREEARELLERLEKQALVLTRETARLEGQLDTMRRMLPAPLPSLGCTSGIARCKEYNDAFAYGYALRDPQQEAIQLAVLRSFMADNVAVTGAAPGLDGVVANWKKFGSCFPALRKECQAWDVIDVDDETCLVKSFALLHLRIGRVTLERLFPQVLSNEYLVQRLLGRVLICPVTQLFFMAAVGDQFLVTRLGTELSLVTAFVALLGGMDDVLEVLHGGKVTVHAQIEAPLKR
ncbi:hypothetical protein ACHHYP_06862 [Achlya hypogyna]|uniref:Bzip transcription factor n=1 Tax=Achlya hypogyna TaxID=1202772 RepID=A0A1V9YRL4_ACHHY|nr:hypothetical protein ACHHYP_06862 [Achlya hypogyna]